MTLRDVLQLPVMKPASVATDRELDSAREVTSVSVQEIPVDKFIRPGELVLSTGMDVGKHAGRLARFIRDVAESGASALALAVGPHTPRISPSAVQAAHRAGLPLIRLPWEVRFSDISESILRRLIQEQAKTRTRDDFVWALATHSAGEDTLASQARQLGFDPRSPHVAIVGKLPAAHARVAEEICHKIAAEHNLRWLGAVIGESILGYLEAPAVPPKIDAICKAVQRVMRERCVIAWGVGRTCHGLTNFPKSYEDARTACEIGQRVRGAEAITHVADILADRVLLNLRHDADVAMLLARYIQPLKASKRTPLLLTLEVFFECDCNASAAARKLSISRQSLLYRLDKIAALLKVDLRSTEEKFALDLALRLNRFSDNMSKEIGG